MLFVTTQHWILFARMSLITQRSEVVTLSACCLSVYCAVGLASYELYDFVDFDNWFTTKLTADLNVSHTKWVLSIFDALLTVCFAIWSVLPYMPNTVLMSVLVLPPGHLFLTSWCSDFTAKYEICRTFITLLLSILQTSQRLLCSNCRILYYVSSWLSSDTGDLSCWPASWLLCQLSV